MCAVVAQGGCCRADSELPQKPDLPQRRAKYDAVKARQAVQLEALARDSAAQKRDRLEDAVYTEARQAAAVRPRPCACACPPNLPLQHAAALDCLPHNPLRHPSSRRGDCVITHLCGWTVLAHDRRVRIECAFWWRRFRVVLDLVVTICMAGAAVCE